MRSGPKKKGRLGWIIAAVVLSVILVVMVGVFALNRWEITVSLNGPKELTLEYGESYTESGASATFHGSWLFPKGWPVEVTASGEVDPDHVGTYTVRYNAQNRLLRAEASRTVTIQDTKAPEITLVEQENHYTEIGQEYEEDGFSATDNYDGDLTNQVVREIKGNQVIYTVTDSSGNQAQVTRTIRYNDPVPPVLELKGEDTVDMVEGTEFEEPGYTATDNVDGDLTGVVAVEGDLDVNTPGTYTLTYTVKDSFGNIQQAKRTVVVRRGNPRPITIPDNVTPNGKVIYLTFDDGPCGNTQRLLDILAKYNVKATFFVTGNGDRSLLKAIVDGGHSIGIHTMTHRYEKVYASDQAFLDDLYGMQDIIYEATGVRTTLMRFPGGSSNTISRKYSEGIMTRLTKTVQERGFQYFDWNVSSGDADGAKTYDEVYYNVIDGCKNKQVSIVLQHDLWGFSVDAVEYILQWGLANGYTFQALTSDSPGMHHSINN